MNAIHSFTVFFPQMSISDMPARDYRGYRLCPSPKLPRCTEQEFSKNVDGALREEVWGA